MGEYYPFEVLKVHKLNSMIGRGICGRRARRFSKTVIGVTCQSCRKIGVEFTFVDSKGNKSEMKIRGGKAVCLV